MFWDWPVALPRWVGVARLRVVDRWCRGVDAGGSKSREGCATGLSSSIPALSPRSSPMRTQNNRLSKKSLVNLIRGPSRFPLTAGQSGEGQQPVSGFLQAVGNGTTSQPPLANDRFAARFYLLRRARVDYVVVVGSPQLRCRRQRRVADKKNGPRSPSDARAAGTRPL